MPQLQREGTLSGKYVQPADQPREASTLYVLCMCWDGQVLANNKIYFAVGECKPLTLESGQRSRVVALGSD